MLHTNVLSEVLKPGANSKLIAWLDAEPVESVYISTITVLSLLDGVGRLPRLARVVDPWLKG